jgi:hypothetical protein
VALATVCPGAGTAGAGVRRALDVDVDVDLELALVVAWVGAVSAWGAVAVARTSGLVGAVRAVRPPEGVPTSAWRRGAGAAETAVPLSEGETRANCGAAAGWFDRTA